ncbi:tRNA (adenosine(37)-N6)-dimethylallyltransferase MiaA [candidate division KSB1 bacterium]
MSDRFVIFIVGPTGVGKTKISIDLAVDLKGEIISADSRQFYKYMNIGTDKVPLDKRKGIPHYFLDIIDPNETYNSGLFGKDAREKIDEIFNNGKLPFVVGGSGLYIKSTIEGFFNEPIRNPEIKKKLRIQAEEEGNAYLYNELKNIDPEFAHKISINDTQRIIRGLEVFKVTGKPLTQHWKDSKVSINFKPIIIGLNRDRKEIYERINFRVEKMFKNGLIEEVKNIRDMGFDESLNALQTYGYREVLLFLNNELEKDEMIELIKKRTRNFSKRQITWFKKMDNIKWFDLGEDKDTYRKIKTDISEIMN